MDEFVSLFLIIIFTIISMYLMFNLKSYMNIGLLILLISITLHINIYVY
jgi:hypothetical protein